MSSIVNAEVGAGVFPPGLLQGSLDRCADQRCPPGTPVAVAAAPPRPHALKAWQVVSLVLVFTALAALVGVTSYFRLSRETRALRQSALGALEVPWNHHFNLNVGFFTAGLARIGSQLTRLPEEARMAIGSVRGAEVGYYDLQGTAGLGDPAAILTRADNAMKARRWDRVVGVMHGNELVAVYTPHNGNSARTLRCCVLVSQPDKLIVAGATTTPDSLVRLAQTQMEKAPSQRFVMR